MSDLEILRIATRKSPLALWQAEFVKQQLIAEWPALKIELVSMVTQGDKILDSPLAKIGGKGLFVKELETGLLEGRADIAVHSMKDVPAELPKGLSISVILKREDPRDAFVSPQYQSIDRLPKGARVGTSSLRRQCQIRRLRPDLEILDLRGNVGTRLAKLDNGEYDAIVLASAGLKRLGLEKRIAQSIQTEEMLPAIGQGAIGIELRTNDDQVKQTISVLNDAETSLCVCAERAYNNRLEGGCQAPIAGHAVLQQGQLWLRGLVGKPDGSYVITEEIEGEQQAAEQLGAQLGDRVLRLGADKILAELRDY